MEAINLLKELHRENSNGGIISIVSLMALVYLLFIAKAIIKKVMARKMMSQYQNLLVQLENEPDNLVLKADAIQIGEEALKLSRFKWSRYSVIDTSEVGVAVEKAIARGRIRRGQII